jgi:hypothetical protein
MIISFTEAIPLNGSHQVLKRKRQHMSHAVMYSSLLKVEIFNSWLSYDSVRPQPLPFTSFAIAHSVVSLQFDTV